MVPLWAPCQCRWSHGALKRKQPEHCSMSARSFKWQLFYFKAEHCAAYRKSMAEGSNHPIVSVVSPSCPSKSVTVTGQSLTGQAAVLACRPVTSRPICRDIWICRLLRPGDLEWRSDHAKNTLRPLPHPPVQVRSTPQLLTSDKEFGLFSF